MYKLEANRSHSANDCTTTSDNSPLPYRLSHPPLLSPTITLSFEPKPPLANLCIHQQPTFAYNKAMKSEGQL